MHLASDIRNSGHILLLETFHVEVARKEIIPKGVLDKLCAVPIYKWANVVC